MVLTLAKDGAWTKRLRLQILRIAALSNIIDKLLVSKCSRILLIEKTVLYIFG